MFNIMLCSTYSSDYSEYATEQLIFTFPKINIKIDSRLTYFLNYSKYAILNIIRNVPQITLNRSERRQTIRPIYSSNYSYQKRTKTNNKESICDTVGIYYTRSSSFYCLCEVACHRHARKK